MKLFEVIQHKHITTRQPNRKFYTRNYYDDERDGDDSYDPELDDYGEDDRLGTGEAGIVFPDEDPHMVRRIGRQKGNIKGSASKHAKRDPYVTYAKWVVDEKLWEKNIHFPRIYVTEYDETNDIFDYTMEKLFPYTKLTRKMVWGMLHNYFDKDSIEDGLPRGVKEDPSTDEYSLRDLLYTLVSLTDLAVMDAEDIVINDEFDKACQMLGVQIDDNGWDSDLTRHNIMFRLTNTGPQLVFTDPVTM